MFNIHHDLDAVLIAALGVVSILWLGRNIYMAFKDILQENSSNTYTGHTAG